MKIKLEQIFSATTAIRKIDLNAPAGRESFILNDKFSKPLFSLIERIELQRNKLIEKYGTRNEKGIPTIKGESENWSAFSKDYNELLAEEVDVDIMIIPMELALSANLTSAEARAMEPFIQKEKI